MANILLYNGLDANNKESTVLVKLPYGSYTLNELRRMKFNPALINQIVLADKMKVIVYTGPNYNGDTYIFNAGDVNENLVDAGDLYNYGLYGKIQSLVVTSQAGIVCGKPDEIKENGMGMEHFDSSTLVNTCHYMCSSLTLINLVILVILLVALFMVFSRSDVLY